MNRFVAVAAAVTLTAGCGTGAPAGDSDGSGADVRAAEDALLAFFDALERMDFAALESTVTADFELVEDTLVLDTPGFIDFLEPYAEAGASISYEFSDFNTEVRGPVAWTRYRNRAVLTMDGRETRFEWLESAVFEKTDGEWKLDRLQSAPVRIE